MIPTHGNLQLAKSQGRQDKRAGRAESQLPVPISVSWTLRTNRNSSSVTCVLSRDERLHRAVLCWRGWAWPAGGEERGEEEKRKKVVSLGIRGYTSVLTC